MTHRVSLNVWHTCGIAVNRKVRQWCGMARDDLHFRLRIPEGLKLRVEKAAKYNRRSMTAEIVATLEEKYPATSVPNLGSRSFHLAATMSDEQRDDFLAHMIDYWEAMAPKEQIPHLISEVEGHLGAVRKFEATHGRKMTTAEITEYIDEHFPF
ncbi:helix-turn-helix domain-containing protein [Phaeobacter inhibens]|uniref:Helix-turn-helix domain-containing protein n=2 Tax=Phaeobacter inhibens TaxID=221822 RepID=A0ABM6RDK2_9RHOB|nr:helix-turn-helix domain-containing protein [Phaeobacter inhibens]AUQ94505.1 helix-turn-helix domain-containing protein [Phaeobacter inhibens]AUR19754.1 helix-turn-helix domain-containing protein [Phaeobacter inhibens]